MEEEKKLSQFVSGYLTTKKIKKINPIAITPEGGGYGLNGPAIKKITFLQLPLTFYLSSRSVVQICPLNKSKFPHLQLAPSGFHYAKRNSVSVSSFEAFYQISDLFRYIRKKKHRHNLGIKSLSWCTFFMITEYYFWNKEGGLLI